MIIDSPIISGSYAATGSLNQVGNVVITGSLTVTEQITGSINSASFSQFAITASYAGNTTSASYAATATSSSYSINSTTASYANTATSASYAASSTSASFAQSAISASNALTASYLSNYIAPFPYTGSAGISGSLSVNGNITSTGTLTAQQLNVQIITSSVEFVTGSTQFGSLLANTHIFTGSVSITGSLAVNNSPVILTNQTSSMSVLSASYAANSTSASYSNTSTSASYANSASYAATAISASYANSSSYAATAISSSYAAVATTSSYTLTASVSLEARNIVLPVKNVSGVQINKGAVVRISDATGDNAIISLADWTNDNQSANTIGLVTADIPNDSFGYVMTEGTFLGYDTSTPGWVAGQLVYLGASGSITGSAPQAPLHGVRLGQVLRVQQINGSIYLRIDNGIELGEAHDVRDTTTTSSFGDLLVKSGSVWINSKQLTGSYGVTGSITSTNGGFTGSLLGTASFATSASQAQNAVSAAYSAYALTSSYSLAGSGFPFSGSAVITGSLLVTNLGGSNVKYLVTDNNGNITAQDATASIKQIQTFTASAGQTTFNITNGYTTGLVDVFVNGTKLNPSEFTDTSGTSIVLLTGSFANDIVEFNKYLPAAGVTNNSLRQQTTFTATAGQTVFSASYTPGLIDIFYNGSRLTTTEYTANNGTFFTLATASAANDILDVFVYSYQVGAFSGIGGGGAATQIAYFNTTNSITGSPNFTISGSTMTVTGSLLVSGSGTFTNIGPAVFSGSLTSTQGFTGSFSGTATNSSLLNGSGSGEFVPTGSFNTFSSSILTYTGSANSRFSSIETVTGSNISRLSSIEAKTGSYATTGSNTFVGNQVITGSLLQSGSLSVNGCIVSTGQIVAQTINVQQVTSSIVYSCGSNIFGNSISNTQTITGSVNITGSLNTIGRICASNISAGTSTICGNLLISETTATTLALYNNGSLRVCLGMTGNEGDISAYRSDGSKNVYLSSYYDSYITGPGKFGLNCTTPYYLLDVNGTARVMNGIYFNNSGGSFLWEQGNNCLRFGTNDTERFKISGDGVACFACQVCTNGTTIRGGNDLRLYRSQNDYYWRINPDSSNFLQIGPYCSNGTPYSSCNTLTFRDDGKLGIGTQNPVNVLDVYKCNNTNVNMSITNLYINQGNLIQFCQNTSGGNVLAYMGHAGDSTGDFVLFNGSTGTPRYSISCLGITSFACQVCAPQYITTQGSSVSYAVGTDYTIWNSEAESCIQDNNNPAAYTRIKTWIADRSGCATIRFTGYIVSGPTYWGYRVTRNGTSSYMCVSYAQCGQPGCASPYVHSYSSYQFNVGPFLPGDCIGLDVVSTGGGATPAPGQGQYILAKEFRVFSSTPNFAAGTAGNVFGEWVGIGTCTPFSNLYINGNNPATYDASVDNGQDGCGVTLTVRNNSTTTNSFAQLNLQVSGDSGRAVGRIALIRTASATGDIAFVNESGNTKNEVMRLISDGKVAIGTTNANGYVLRISSNSNNNPSCAAKLMVLGNDVVNAVSGFMYIGSYAGLDWLVGKDTSGVGDYRFNLSLYTGEQRMTLYTNGNYSFAGSNVSDLRLKCNINALCINAIDKINQLTPKCYNMDGIMRYGFVAQDVKPVLSDLITGEEKEKEYLGLDYNGLLTVAVKAIQEQQCTINALKTCLGIS